MWEPLRPWFRFGPRAFGVMLGTIWGTTKPVKAQRLTQTQTFARFWAGAFGATLGTIWRTHLRSSEGVETSEPLVPFCARASSAMLGSIWNTTKAVMAKRLAQTETSAPASFNLARVLEQNDFNGRDLVATTREQLHVSLKMNSFLSHKVVAARQLYLTGQML